VKRNWSEIGTLRLLIPFIAGIFLFSYIGLSFHSLVILSILLFLFTLVIKYSNTRFILAYFDEFFGLAVFFTILSLSLLSCHLHDARFVKDISSSQQKFYGYLKSDIIEKGKSYKAEVRLILEEGDGIHNETNSIVYFQKDSRSALLKKGDFVSLKNNFLKPAKSLGDSEFNYRRFLSLKNIYFTSYQNSTKWQYISTIEPSGYERFIGTLRNRFQESLERYIQRPRERAIASALLLGNKSLLDKETRQTYSETGAMHILAVSGLHVGILYGFLALVLARFKRRRIGAISAMILEISVIWIFAAITDFSPSVSRASVMFTFLAMGSSLTRYTNIYNILALSALLLLAYNPNYLFEVGFQLSYAAVFSIVFFHKYIYRLFMIKNKVIDFFWNISAVSIAAQLGTAPLTMLYFGQFPSYFFLSNLLAIPAATVILWLGMLLFTITSLDQLISIEVLQRWIGNLLDSVIYILNLGLESIQSIPFAVVDIDGFYPINTISMYLVVVALMYFLYQNALNKSRFRIVLLAIAIHIVLLNYSQIYSFSKKADSKEVITLQKLD